MTNPESNSSQSTWRSLFSAAEESAIIWSPICVVQIRQYLCSCPQDAITSREIEMIVKRTALALSVAAALMMNFGCGNSSESDPATAGATGHDDDHDHSHGGHHHAETLPEAITELTEMRNTIRDAFAKNDVDTAHDPLHEVAHVLELIPGLAEKQGITGDALATIKSSTETLFEAFGNVDKTLHGGEGSTYAEESEKIDAALKAIVDAAAAGPATDATPADAPPADETATPPADTATPPADTATPPADTATPPADGAPVE